MHKNTEFQEIFDRLKTILMPYSENLVTDKNEPGDYWLNTNFVMKNKKRLFFAAVKIGKNYVSYHLMPIYVFPDLLRGISPDLTRRKQGKSCFNFKSVDTVLFDELTALTKNAYLEYQKAGYV